MSDADPGMDSVRIDPDSLFADKGSEDEALMSTALVGTTIETDGAGGKPLGKDESGAV